MLVIWNGIGVNVFMPEEGEPLSFHGARCGGMLPTLLGRDLAGAVLELPRRIGENRPESPPRAVRIRSRCAARGVSGENIMGS